MYSTETHCSAWCSVTETFYEGKSVNKSQKAMKKILSEIFT
jgi:hypothetical protein